MVHFERAKAAVTRVVVMHSATSEIAETFPHQNPSHLIYLTSTILSSIPFKSCILSGNICRLPDPDITNAVLHGVSNCLYVHHTLSFTLEMNIITK